MYRIKAFALRNIKELSRDPLSCIFCLGFPVIMLIIMTVVNESIPPEANVLFSGLTILQAVYQYSGRLLLCCLPP